MGKKLFKTLAALTLVAAMLVGCGAPAADPTKTPGGNGTPTNSASDPAKNQDQPGNDQPAKTVDLSLGIWPEDTLTADIEIYKGYVATMKNLHPEVNCIPAYYKYATDTFMPMVEAKTVPTIFETWFTEPKKLIANGAVADITDVLKSRGWLDNMNPSIRELLSDDNGRIYGVPRDGYALGLMLNVELFEEAGLVDKDGYPLYPTSMQDLAEKAKIIKEKTGAAGLCLLAKNEAGGWHFSNIAWNFGATELCKDNLDGTFTSNLATPEAIKAMEFVKSLKWDYDVLTADPTNEDWGTGFMQLGTGAAAMYIGANDAVAQPTQVNGLPVDKLAMCGIPAAEGCRPYSLFGGTPYMFSKESTPEQIAAALDFLEVIGKAPLATDDAIAGMKADAQSRVNNGVPVIASFPCWTAKDFLDAQDAIVKEYSNVDAKMFNAYFDATKNNGLHPEEPGLTQDMYAELTKVLQEVLTNKNADVAALMRQANENYQKILDNGFKK
ncbi:MAG: sugar ABC transporter substrate-binding protein [Lachnospiraceae bacterium]|nr:sugar ABC transporter substrate-binding protein [Lachnospiraceae bacterium]MBP5183649.1 sugar ABC transporter substrate-binding protein [Lachnospiraceae bacterium]